MADKRETDLRSIIQRQDVFIVAMMLAVSGQAYAQDNQTPPVNGAASGVEAAAAGDEESTEPFYSFIGASPGDVEPNGRNGFSETDMPNLFEPDGESDVSGSALAAAYATGSQTAFGNTVTMTNGARAALEKSFQNFEGVAGVNQNAGDGSSQANIVSISRATAGGGAIAVADTVQHLFGNSVADRAPQLETLIADSFNNASGVVGINQSAGALNQQINALAVAFSIGGEGEAPAAMIGDVELGSISTNTDNQYESTEDQTRTTGVVNSFNNFTGVAQVSQAAGSLNQVSQKIGMTYTVHGGGS